MSNIITPQIRFAGFTDAWEQRKVGEWGYFYYGHSCPKWSVTEDATTPCIRYGEMYTKFGCKIDRVYSYTNIPKDQLKFSKGTEVLVPRVGEDPMDYNHCTWLSLANIAIGEMISVYNTEQNPLFTAIMFNATLKYEFAKRVEGGSVTNLYYEKLLEIPVSFPNIEEQKKIASFFENIESLITLHQRKCDTLQKFKKSMLQKMFPQNGESVPEIRFAGFTDAWEQRKLGECVTFLDTMRKPLKESEREKGIYPYYGASGIVDYVSDYIFDEELVLLSEDGANITDRNYPVCFLASGKYWVNNHAHVLKVNAENENNFICNSLERMDFTQYNSGMAMPKLNKDVCHNIPFFCPVYEEQKQIGDFFRHLDSLITLHQRKLETLQKMKKSLLQKMFV